MTTPATPWRRALLAGTVTVLVAGAICLGILAALGLIGGGDAAPRPAGTPVVAAAVGGLPVAVRDGETGTLVHSHDVDEWTAAIGALLDRGPDTLRAAAVAHAATFSWAHTVDALLASYRRAITDHRARDQQRDAAARRNGRIFTRRRGVRA